MLEKFSCIYRAYLIIISGGVSQDKKFLTSGKHYAPPHFPLQKYFQIGKTISLSKINFKS
jgi:hypothetical protein